jgi:hypothetical protein
VNYLSYRTRERIVTEGDQLHRVEIGALRPRRRKSRGNGIVDLAERLWARNACCTGCDL